MLIASAANAKELRYGGFQAAVVVVPVSRYPVEVYNLLYCAFTKSGFTDNDCRGGNPELRLRISLMRKRCFCLPVLPTDPRRQYPDPGHC